jgi:hypothetical protein
MERIAFTIFVLLIFAFGWWVGGQFLTWADKAIARQVAMEAVR